MPVRSAEAVWLGGLRGGNGTVKVESGLFSDSPYSFVSRFEQGRGTNPEELLGAAFAGCFSMALAEDLELAGYKPQKVHTAAQVHIDRVGGGFTITRIDLETEAQVAGIDEQTFLQIAQGTKGGCPVARALAAVEATLKAKLVK